MFFTHDVLINTGGKFAIIWLAAMQNRKIKKRDYQSVELEQTCDELQKHFKPRSDGRMASVKGFSLRLSAQLVYGVLVVYHMKVSYLYNDANLSLQNLRRFKAQNQIYPSIPQIPTPRMTTVEMRHDDPIFGELFLLPEELNKSNMMMEDSLRSRSEIDDRFVVKDISNITLSDQPLHQVVGDSEFLDTNIDMEGFMGTNLFEDLDIVASSVDARLANITTPALHLPKTPQRPGKATERSKSPLADDLSVLAVPLSAEPEPLLSAPEPLLSAPEPLLSAPEPLLSAPEPLLSAPEPLPSTPQSITAKAIDRIALEQTATPKNSLVLDPIGAVPSNPTRRTRVRPHKLSIDKEIMLSTSEIRNQLLQTDTDCNEYFQSYCAFPHPLPSSSLLAFHPCATSHELDPKRHHPFQCKQDHRVHFYKRRNIANILFSDITEAMQRFPKREFSKRDNTVYYEQDSVARPDDFNEIQYLEHDLSVFQNHSSVDESIRTVEEARIENTFVAGIPSFNASEMSIANTTRSSLKLDSNSNLESPRQDSPKYSTLRRIDELSGMTFAALVPPKVTSRKSAVREFANLLRLAKSQDVLLRQDETFGDIIVMKVAEGHL